MPDGGVVAVDGANWRWKAASRPHLHARHRARGADLDAAGTEGGARIPACSRRCAATAGASSPSEPRSELPPPSAIPEQHQQCELLLLPGRAAIIEALYTVRGRGRARLGGGMGGGEGGEGRWGGGAGGGGAHPVASGCIVPVESSGVACFAKGCALSWVFSERICLASIDSLKKTTPSSACRRKRALLEPLSEGLALREHLDPIHLEVLGALLDLLEGEGEIHFFKSKKSRASAA